MSSGTPSSSSDLKKKAKLQEGGPKCHGGSTKLGLVFLKGQTRRRTFSQQQCKGKVCKSLVWRGA